MWVSFGAGYYVQARMIVDWSLSAIAAEVRRRLARPLPGLDAQVRMAPRPRRGWKPGQSPEESRPAAALLLLYEHDGEATCVLTVRSHLLPQHAGQVSLPGGAVDEGEPLIDAARREAEEEVGVPASHVEVLGTLTPLHIPVSGFMLHPFIGTTADRPSFAPAHGEVSRVVEVPVRELASPGTWQLTTWTYEGREYEIPFFGVHGLQVWGATAMVLSEFLGLLGVQVEATRTAES
jgi:8-oxo-dGTP pyrophosphatase MutT (NUDIX family)